MDPKLSIAVYVGTFDPFHAGHIEVALCCTNYAQQVLIIPNPIHHHKRGVMELKHRIALVKCQLPKDNNLSVTDWQTTMKLGDAIAQDDKRALFLLVAEMYGVEVKRVAEVVGSDSLAKYPASYFVGQTILVMNRSGSIDHLPQHDKDLMMFIPVGTQQKRRSSTVLRKYLPFTTNATELIDYGLNYAQYRYIRSNELYGVSRGHRVTGWDILDAIPKFEVGIDIGGSSTKIAWRYTSTDQWLGFSVVAAQEHAQLYENREVVGEKLLKVVESVTGMRRSIIQKIGLSVTGLVDHPGQTLILSDRLNEFSLAKGGYDNRFPLAESLWSLLTSNCDMRVSMCNDSIASALGSGAFVTGETTFVLTLGTSPAASVIVPTAQKSYTTSEGCITVFDCEAWLSICELDSASGYQKLHLALKGTQMREICESSRRVGSAIALLLDKLAHHFPSIKIKRVIITGGKSLGLDEAIIIQSLRGHFHTEGGLVKIVDLPASYEEQSQRQLDGALRYGDLFFQNRITVKRLGAKGPATPGAEGFELTCENPVTIDNCDKDGSIVAARIGGAVGRSTYTRHLCIDHIENTDHDAVAQFARKTVQYYEAVGKIDSNPLLSSKTLVFGTVHHASLYLAEVLHAPILPMQFLEFTRSIDRLGKGPHLQMIGCDYDRTDCYWVYNKISNLDFFPVAYRQLMKNANSLVLLYSSSEVEEQCEILGRIGENGYVNRTLKSLRGEKGGLFQNIESRLCHSDIMDKDLGQWEWGLPKASIECLRQEWLKLGKSADNFHIVKGGSVSLYKSILPLWKQYLDHNGIRPLGFTVSGYWMSFPALERLAGLLPIHFYSFEMVQKFATDFLADVSSARATDDSFADSSDKCCIFANDIGNRQDPSRMQKWLKNLQINTTCWFSSKGFNCPDSECRDIFNSPIPLPAEKVSEWLQTAPYRDKEFEPLPLAEALGAVQPFEYDKI